MPLAQLLDLANSFRHACTREQHLNSGGTGRINAGRAIVGGQLEQPPAPMRGTATVRVVVRPQTAWERSGREKQIAETELKRQCHGMPPSHGANVHQRPPG